MVENVVAVPIQAVIRTGQRDVALIALLVAIGLQLMPLPTPLVTRLSPHAESIRSAIQFSTFAAAFPMDKPRYVIISMMDEPKGTAASSYQRTAAYTAAPVVARLVVEIRSDGPEERACSSSFSLLMGFSH